MDLSYEVFHRHLDELVDFYVQVLGFTVQKPYRPDADYAEVCRNAIRVGCSVFADASTSPRKPPHGCEIVLRVDNLRAEYERVRARGWPIEDEPQRRPWGNTDFRIFDPSGQYLRITN